MYMLGLRSLSTEEGGCGGLIGDFTAFTKFYGGRDSLRWETGLFEYFDWRMGG